MTSSLTFTPRDPRGRRPRERGAALILTVVVIMILTTLALTMATFTVTEERTATTYRDSLQTRAVAEAGARVVQEMFRSPTDRELVPLYSAAATADGAGWDYWGANDAAIETELNQKGIWRADRSGTNPARYSGNDNRFFQGPFKESWARLFSGTYSNDPATAPDRYDLKFNCTNPNDPTVVVPSADCWLDSKINALLDNGPLVANKYDFNFNTGKITDISFYAPPAVGGRAYGLATIRITAVKYDSDNPTSRNVIARETIEAVMIDTTPKPAVLGNGNIVFVLQGGAMCGDGCEQIHANGNAQVGTITGGSDPMVSATGTVSGGSGSTKDGARAVYTPHINPWDLNYKPTLTNELDKYYLAAARKLDDIWTNADPTDNTPARPCGPGLWSFCQDYGLEYTAAGVPKPRTAANVPYLYKWDAAKAGWTECDNTSPLTAGTCAGAPTFNVTSANDLVVAGTDDLNVIPYNILTVPQTEFTINTKQDGATVLVDGKFYKSGSMDAIMTIIAVGSIGFHASSTWYPAMSNRMMWVSGRDIDTHSNCCAASNTCATNLVGSSTTSIIAAHEQIKNDSQTALLGVILGENRVNFDPTVNSSLALDLVKGDHGSLCNDPEWPWTLPVTPAIASMKTAMN